MRAEIQTKELLPMHMGHWQRDGTPYNNIFAEYQITFLIIYMDDLLTCTKNILRAKHAECVHKVLQKIREHDLFLKVSKCTFFQEQVEFLRMTVLGKGITMSADKVKAIADWQPPT